MTAREQLESVLAEFSRETGQTIGLDENNGCTIQVSLAFYNLVFLPKAGQILLWVILGRLEHDANVGARARRLLEMNDGWQESCGGSFMFDRENGLVILADRRSVESIYTADNLAAWIGELERGYRFAVKQLEFKYPYVDDDPLDEDAPMIREIQEDGKESV